MKNKIFKSRLLYIVILGTLVSFAGCKSDMVDNGFVSSSNLNADFSITTVSTNKFILTSSNDNYILSQWDLGNGGGYLNDSNNINLFLPDAGTYTIKHRVMGAGGVFSSEVIQTINVATSDPNSGNLVLGGKFADATDIGKWTVDNLTGGIVTFSDGWCKFTNVAGSWGQAAIQQPIQVEAGKTYTVDMLFKTTGVTQGWFKVYACTTPPTAGVEYKSDILIAEVNIWSNSNAISGKFSSVLNPESGTQTSNKVTFATSGTIYLSIQCGAEDLKDGVYVSNIEFRGVSE